MGYDSAPSPAMWVRVDLLRMGGGRQWTGVGGSSALSFAVRCARGRSVVGRWAVFVGRRQFCSVDTQFYSWLRVSGPVVGFVAWPAEGSR